MLERIFDRDLFLGRSIVPWTWRGTWSTVGEWYDPRTHKLVPRPEYIDEELKHLESVISEERDVFNQRQEELAKEKERLLSLKIK